MTTSNTVLGQGASFSLLIGVWLACRTPAAAQGTNLYDLDFTPPAVGTYQVVAGNPAVQSTVGPFPEALVFGAVNGGEEIRLPIGVAAPGYDFQCDVLAHNLVNSDYAFRVFMDTAAACSLDFDGGLNTVYVYQSYPFLNLSLEPLTNDSVYHLDVSLDTQDSVWSVAVNGTSVFGGALDGSPLQDIRFDLEPWIGGAANAPNTYLALDNVIISTIPEPTTVGLAAAGGLFWLRIQRGSPQNRK